MGRPGPGPAKGREDASRRGDRLRRRLDDAGACRLSHAPRVRRRQNGRLPATTWRRVLRGDRARRRRHLVHGAGHAPRLCAGAGRERVGPSEGPDRVGRHDDRDQVRLRPGRGDGAEDAGRGRGAGARPSRGRVAHPAGGPCAAPGVCGKTGRVRGARREGDDSRRCRAGPRDRRGRVLRRHRLLARRVQEGSGSRSCRRPSSPRARRPALGHRRRRARGVAGRPLRRSPGASLAGGRRGHGRSGRRSGPSAWRGVHAGRGSEASRRRAAEGGGDAGSGHGRKPRGRRRSPTWE